jgi:hypothetical protein
MKSAWWSFFPAAWLLCLWFVAPTGATAQTGSPWVDPPLAQGEQRTVLPPPSNAPEPAVPQTLMSPAPGHLQAPKREEALAPVPAPSLSTSTGSLNRPEGSASSREVRSQPPQLRPKTKRAATTQDSKVGARTKAEGSIRKSAAVVEKAKPRLPRKAVTRRQVREQIARAPMSRDDQLTYEYVIRNGVEVDPTTIGGVPPGYRAYRVPRPAPTVPPAMVVQQMLLYGLLSGRRGF